MAETYKPTAEPNAPPEKNGRIAVTDPPPAAEAAAPTAPPRPSEGGDGRAQKESRTTRPSWVKPLFLIALLILLVIGTVLGLRYWRFASTHVSTDDAAIASDVIDISPQVSGTIKQVLVHENQVVKTGDLLVVLDDSTYRAAYDQAKANLDAAIAQAKGADVNVSLTQETGSAQEQQAQGIVSQAESSISSATADVARAVAGIANSRATTKSAQANVLNAQSAVSAAIDNKQRYIDAVTAAQAAVDTAHAGVRAAQAAVDAAQAVYDRAARDADRYTRLVAEGASSQQVADQATATARQDQAQLESAKQQVAQAQAVVAQNEANLNAARRQVNSANDAIAQARAQLTAVREQVTATQAGIGQAIATRNAALQSVKQAEARRQQALGQLQQAHTTPSQVAVSRSAVRQDDAKIEQARAALDAARIQLDYTRIYAPVSGRINKKTVEIGALVQPGTPLMSIVPENDVWVVANYKETQLAAVHPGQPADVDVDGLPGRTFHGRVDSIAAGTGSTFTLLPPDNATGNFTKVVQRIPVKIVFDPNQPDMDRLRAGMSVTATIATK